MSPPQLKPFQAKLTKLKQNKTAQRCPPSPPQGLLSPPPLLFVLTQPRGESVRPLSPGQWGGPGRGWPQLDTEKHGLRAHLGKACWGLGHPSAVRGMVHSDQQTPLLWHPAPFREKSLEPLASGGWKGPYLSCRKGNGAERMGLPQCVPEESTLLCEPFMLNRLSLAKVVRAAVRAPPGAGSWAGQRRQRPHAPQSC